MKAEDCRTLQDVYKYGYEIGMRDDAQSGETVVLPSLTENGRVDILSWFNVYPENTHREKYFMAGFRDGCNQRAELKVKRIADRIADRKAIRHKFAHARSRTLRARGW